MRTSMPFPGTTRTCAVPAWAPHGVANTGDTTLKVVGFFGSAVIAHMSTEQLVPGDGSLVVLHTPAGELQPVGVA